MSWSNQKQRDRDRKATERHSNLYTSESFETDNEIDDVNKAYEILAKYTSNTNDYVIRNPEYIWQWYFFGNTSHSLMLDFHVSLWKRFWCWFFFGSKFEKVKK